MEVADPVYSDGVGAAGPVEYATGGTTVWIVVGLPAASLVVICTVWVLVIFTGTVVVVSFLVTIVLLYTGYTGVDIGLLDEGVTMMLLSETGGEGVGYSPLQTSLWKAMYCALSAELHAALILASMVRALRAVQMHGKSAGLHLLSAKHSKRMVC
jgi:hypothetical protein